MPFAAINKQEIFYQDTGNVDKPTLMFMHGFLFNQSLFDPQVEAFKEDYRCVRFDARAFGQTKWDGQPFNLYDTVADCVGLMDELGIETATMVGMSQGGYASFRVGLKHPSRVDSLVLLSTAYMIDDDEFKQNYRSVRDLWKKNGKAPDFIINNLLTLFLGQKEERTQFWETWQPQFENTEGENVFHAMNNLLERDEITDEMMQKLTMPSIVIHGIEDRGMPIVLAQKTYERLPNAKEMVKVPDATHAVNLVKPDEVNEAIKSFLTEYVYKD